MEKEKRRKKLDGRVDAETIINEVMEGVDLNKAAQEDAESKLRPQGANPIKKIYSVNLRYAGFEYSDWLKIINSQSECLKMRVA